LKQKTVLIINYKKKALLSAFQNVKNKKNFAINLLYLFHII